jgi:H+/Cl- antiporter ClcA
MSHTSQATADVASSSGPEAPAAPDIARVLLVCAALGLLVSFAVFVFLTLVQKLTTVFWQDLPSSLGWQTPPWWWPLPALLLAGVIAAVAIVSLPGSGGHVPVEGLDAAPTDPKTLPGVLLAAIACLSLGAIIGPEMPLGALGTGVALLVLRRSRLMANHDAIAVIAAASYAAAIAAIFVNPLIAVVLIIEAVAMAGRPVEAVILPCLLSTGVGYLLFSGLGRWTGLPYTFLHVPPLNAPADPAVSEILWAVAIGILCAVGMSVIRRGGQAVAQWVTVHLFGFTVLAALGVGVAIAAYALLTGRSPVEAAFSGSDSIAAMAENPGAWPVSALLLLLACKGIGYALSIGALRGGPIFPAVFLGMTLGVLLSHLPGLNVVSGMAIGMAAASAALMRLPLSAIMIVVLTFGSSIKGIITLVIIAAVVAFITMQILERVMARAKNEAATSAPDTGAETTVATSLQEAP